MKKKEIFKVVLEHLVDEEIFEDSALSLLKPEKTEEFELRKLELEFQKAIREMEIQKELKLKEMELQSRKLDTPRGQTDFDVAKNVRLVPPFSEEDIDKFFLHFERVAINLRWPVEHWTMLIQSVLKGRAQEVYLALSNEASLSYEVVKEAILEAYELAPEAYRQKFRLSKKRSDDTYVEFATEKENLFDWWCVSKEVGEDFHKLRQLILLEEFKLCVHVDIRCYLEEQRVEQLQEAASLADDYSITHGPEFKLYGYCHPDNFEVSEMTLKKNENTSTLNQNSNSTPTAAPNQSSTTISSSTTVKPAADNPEEDDVEATKEDASYLRKILRSKLVTTKTDLEVLRKDPRSPLYFVKTFNDLNLKPELLRGVYAMGFDAPSKIQETALPTLLANPPVNMIAQSQSGTGKTAAFVLTMLSRVDVNLKYPQCLCLAPTYELAIQIGEVAIKMAKFMTDVKIGFAVRGTERDKIFTEQIVIGTPGTALDLGWKFNAFDLQKISVFVLDEADVMIATQGHKDQSIRIQRHLGECQMLLFSATYDAEVMKFAQDIIPNPVTIRLRREEESLDNIKQYYIECQSQDDKFKALSNIYGSISIGQAVVFCKTRKSASWLSEKMSRDGHAVGLLSGELPIHQRADIIRRFREGNEKVLITTNVAARGIDVAQVTMVVNFDLPTLQDGKPDFETYLHRIGRTGRFGKDGIALNMVSRNTLNILHEIERHFARTILKLDANDVDELEKISEN
ncbi:ATP-dependent RNA helicase DDX19A isoform X1 [Octopus bimaculoides]|nr:ATP-dependent RNA helicase DDX19A isoform X1 [Octopus bimaculoides]